MNKYFSYVRRCELIGANVVLFDKVLFYRGRVGYIYIYIYI